MTEKEIERIRGKDICYDIPRSYDIIKSNMTVGNQITENLINT